MSTTGFVPFDPPRGTLIGLGGKLRAGKDVIGDYLEEKHDFVKLGMSDALNEALLKLNPHVRLEDTLKLIKITPDNDVTGPHFVEAGRFVPYRFLHDAVGYVEAKKNPEVRRLLQVLGTEVGRDMIDPDVWVRMAEKKIREHWANGKSVVITAMRFPNEIAMLKRLGGLSVWVERPDSERLATGGLVSPEAAERISVTLRAEPCAIPVPKGRKTDTEPHSAIQEHSSENSVSQEDFQYVILNDGTLEQLYDKVEKLSSRRVMTSGGSISENVNIPSSIRDIPLYPPYDR